MLSLLIAILALSLSATDSTAQIAVIAPPSVPADTITPADLLDLYTYEIRSWRNGEPVVIFDRSYAVGPEIAKIAAF